MLIYACLTDLELAVFLVALVVVIYFYVHQRWRMAAARGEEIRRLTWLAAKEAERVEAEALELAYQALPIVKPSFPEASGRADNIKVGDGTMMCRCVVCYRHTTTRCSRCEAVRYCSKKCQIIHWRQDHKENCHHPNIDEQNNDGESACTNNNTNNKENHVDNDSAYSKNTNKIDNASSSFLKLAETKGSVHSGASELKTSVRGAVSDISQKDKISFPYDLFVRLYNCNKEEMHPSGLINCGNSCYANAVLQCLAFTRPLTSYLLQGLHTEICLKEGWCFTCELESLLKKAKQGQIPLSPATILSNIKNLGGNLGHGREEDAHEFLRYAIDTMQSVCLKAGTKADGSHAEEATLINLIFGGYLRSKIKCTQCSGKSERHERMMDLTVEIKGNVGTLEEALTLFTTTDVLDGDNRYNCSRCKTYERAKKKLTILEAPNVLTIALKRFQSGKFGKLNKAIKFPEILNLAPYMHATDDKSPVYSLYAIIVHQDIIINATFSGHYVSYVKSAHGKWYKIDDSKVEHVDLAHVLSINAYVLFYARCSPRAPSLIRNAMHNDSRVSRSYRFNDKLPFQRTNSYTDASPIFSYSDEGLCSTHSSTRDSNTSTDELSDYIFGDSGRFYSNSGIYGEENITSCGEGLGRSRDASRFSRSDVSTRSNIESRKLTVDCRGRESVNLNGEKSNTVLIRRVLPSSK